MKTERPGAWVFWFVALDHGFVPDAASCAVLGDLFKEIVVRVEEKRELWNEGVDVHAATHTPLNVLQAIAQSEGQFLNGGGAGFANVIAADGDGIKFGSVFYAELEGVDHQAHGGFGRVDVFLLRDVFLEDVVLQSAGEFFPIGALFFRDRKIHGPDYGGGRIDGHGRGDVGQGNFVEEHFHVSEGTDGHATFADFAFGEGVVGVVTHECGEIEGGGEAGLALREKITETRVGVFGGAEAWSLAHGPQAAAVHGGVNAAGVGRLAR